MTEIVETSGEEEDGWETVLDIFKKLEPDMRAVYIQDLIDLYCPYCGKEEPNGVSGECCPYGS